MLPIILSILKIIGIVLLTLLGLICLIVFVVLVVPVRYRLSGSYGEAVQAKGAVTWLLHAISVTVTYEKELDISVRILGRKLFDKKIESTPADAEESADESWDEPLEEDSPGEFSKDEIASDELSEEISLDGFGEEDTFSDKRSEEGLSPGAQGDVREDWENNSEQAELSDDSDDLDEYAQEEDMDSSGKKWSKSGKKKLKKKKAEKKKSEEAGEDSEKAGEKLRAALDSVKEKWESFKEKKEELETFLKNEANQQTFKLILRQLKKLLRHVLPTKVRGKAVIGFEDPATTGKVLSGLSILYAWCGDNIEITPVFDQAVLEVEGSMKGRIRAGTILLCGVRVLLNRNFRRLLRKIIKSGGKKDGRQ